MANNEDDNPVTTPDKLGEEGTSDKTVVFETSTAKLGPDGRSILTDNLAPGQKVVRNTDKTSDQLQQDMTHSE